MKYSNCITCGKDKATTDRTLCLSCSKKGNTGFSGKIPSEDHRRKLSIAHGGDGKLVKRPYPHAWADRNKLKTPFCEWCYSEEDLEAHHILPRARFPQYATDDSNCRVMCAPCHTICHKQGGF